MSKSDVLLFLTYFPIYAFIGWCLEVIYASVTTGKFVNRGFLNGAICPIYGFGAVLFILFLEPISGNLFYLFIFSMLIASLLELVGGYVLKKLFHMTWWDYSDEPFNIGGYVCLKFSLMWGVAGVVLLRVVHPLIRDFIQKLPQLPVLIALIVFYAVFIADILVTVIAIMHMNRDLKQVTELRALMRKGSDSLAKSIGDKAIDTSEKLEEHKKDISQSLKESSELRKEKREKRSQDIETEWNTLLSRHNLIRSRMLKAFPKLDNLNDHSSLEEMRKHYESYKKDKK
ncbi:MAG: hypothetical protein LBM95_09260 [Lactobacillales bacterium]|jgi:uncharacterized membrane protein|nr:hypothetical protein [Lactobacillales bacterium]